MPSIASRSYKLYNNQLGITSASYAKGGMGAQIGYAITDSSLGRLMVAATEHGICFLSLGEDQRMIAELEKEFSLAEILADEIVPGEWVREVIARLEGQKTRPNLPLDVRGTAFQRRVWHELMQIPAGITRTYSELAESISGKASARRSVARCCATNPVFLVIPCHRAVRSDGGLGGYRWGLNRKRALICAELAWRDDA